MRNSPFYDINATIAQLNFIATNEIKTIDYPNMITLGEIEKLRTFGNSLEDIQMASSRIISEQNIRQRVFNSPNNDYPAMVYLLILLVSSYIIWLFGMHFLPTRKRKSNSDINPPATNPIKDSPSQHEIP